MRPAFFEWIKKTEFMATSAWWLFLLITCVLPYRKLTCIHNEIWSCLCDCQGLFSLAYWAIPQLFSDFFKIIFQLPASLFQLTVWTFLNATKWLTPSLVTHLPMFPHLSLWACHPTQWESQWGKTRPYNLQLLLYGISTAFLVCSLVVAATVLTLPLHQGSRPETSNK